MQQWPKPSPTLEVNPSQASIDALAGRPDENAIIMLNLLRYAPGEGRAAYARYGAVAGPVVRSQGGDATYIGSAHNSAGGWDTALLVRYPRRAAYLAMQTNRAYVGAIPDRTAGLAARLLYPFHDPSGPPDDQFQIPTIGPGQALVVCLSDEPVSCKGGHTVLALLGDMPMVSDRTWERCTVLRFASLAAARDATPTDDSIWLITQPQSL